MASAKKATAKKEKEPLALYDGSTLLMNQWQMILVALGCLGALLLSLLDINIVGAVVWKMSAELDPVHGIAMMPWLTTCYALADCIVVPLYGKIADVYGPKPVFSAALGIFVVGSALCGIATSLPELIVFRTIQGVGAGGLAALALVVIGTMFRNEEQSFENKAATQTAFGAVMFGVGLALGPTLGGVIADNLNWRWVFYINLPLALFALFTAVFLLKLPKRLTKRKVDYLGGTLLAGAAAALLLASEWGGTKYAWGSSQIVLMLAGGAVLLGLFVWRILTAADPLISLSILKHPVFRIMMPSSLIAGLGMAGSFFYVSGYLQVARGLTPTAAGMFTLCMAAGLLLSILVGPVLIRIVGKFKYMLTITGVIQAIILFLLSGLTADTPLYLVAVAMFTVGMAMGFSLGLGLQYTQNSVSVEDIGIATTSLRFNQQLGVSIGFAFFATIVTNILASHLTGAAGAANVNGNLDLAKLSGLSPAEHSAAIGAFITAVDTVFLLGAIITLIPAGLALLIKEDKHPKTPGPAAEKVAATA
ncbi:drug resistance transporter, EmrB/QacA subfamily [Amycolatopsis xylanica]|uniref:Drug resistance transporter, EmrB/QacA subfamily n=1 Tax=Amycolatopsis xylanica TaxID=589385 RepID=A0A1H2VQP3_9PSEU|nr:MFS transporter [Amycolatopsis xylanica]SDW70742.1 drug resistance transporter, EmrB/QacA subfamily [Amycolatopsis xylanica]